MHCEVSNHKKRIFSIKIIILTKADRWVDRQKVIKPTAPAVSLYRIGLHCGWTWFLCTKAHREITTTITVSYMQVNMILCHKVVTPLRDEIFSIK